MSNQKPKAPSPAPAKTPSPAPAKPFNFDARFPGCENFFIREMFVTSHNAALLREEFLDLPPAEQKLILQNATNIANRLQAARDFLDLPIHISSWWRSPRVEKAVGGSGTNHYWGDAVDFDRQKYSVSQWGSIYKFFQNTSGGLGWGTAQGHTDLGFGRERTGRGKRGRWMY